MLTIAFNRRTKLNLGITKISFVKIFYLSIKEVKKWQMHFRELCFKFTLYTVARSVFDLMRTQVINPLNHNLLLMILHCQVFPINS